MCGTLLLAIVFCTGACVLILEVLSNRLLAPYFGNTIYAFSSIIGVTLAALSMGYATGGWLADARPRAAYFFCIILLSGMSVLLTKLLSVTLLPRYYSLFSLINGPVIFSILLFTLPSLLLGMLSPFAIRLLQDLNPGGGVGSLSGKVFFFSTLGSIAGTFAAGFMLIPLLGVQTILLILAVFLLVLGAAGLLVTRISIRDTSVFLLMIAVTSGALSLYAFPAKNPGILHQEEGLYQSMMVYDATYQGRPARFLRLNFNPSSAVFLDTGDLLFDYTRYYQFAQALHPDLQTALVIGAGAYSVPQALLKHSPGAAVDVVDIEPSLRAIARTFFGVADDARIRTIVGDGRRFLVEAKIKYDLIFSDAYQSLFSIPSHLVTQEFFQSGANALSEHGVFIANFSARIRQEQPSLLWSAVRTFRSAFPHSSFFAVVSKSSSAMQNVIFLGCNTSDCDDPCRAILESHRSAFLQKACTEKLTILPEEELSKYAILTDDYTPVEFLAARQL